jgi:hypothetical protein
MEPSLVLKKEKERQLQREQKKEKKDKMKKRGKGHVRSSPPVTAAMLLSLATIILLLAGITTSPLAALGSRFGGGEETGFILPSTGEGRKAPSVVTGDNIYIAWWTNNTENGNEEVMFRTSTDGGQTFSDKINLSNTTDADSVDAEIAAEDANVIVTWWERNQTSDTPVARLSTDAGETFGPLIMLGTNGTISTTTTATAEAGAEEEDEEEATAADEGE